MSLEPTLDAVLAARQTIAGRLHRTPTFTSATLSELTGARVYLKAELFQRTGSFKPRGMLNKLASLSAEEKARGVATWSAGNAAQGLAHVAALEGARCRVFLPLNLLRRRLQINLRNHRKILIVDGQVGFTGGLNIGDEYLGKDPRFGAWRDTHLRLEGAAVAALQYFLGGTKTGRKMQATAAPGERCPGSSTSPTCTARRSAGGSS